MLRSDSRSKQSANQYRRTMARLYPWLIKRGSRMSVAVQLGTIVLGTTITTLVNSLALLSPVWANTATLGVVKSPDNERYWSEITTRLQSTGVDYCIIDFSKVQQISDLGSPQLLFLPNIERLELAQLTALQAWMRQGGRVIITGPVGTRSQPEIRTRLRSLLGAYWGFALEKPSPVEPSQTQNQPWVRQARQAGSIWGGVVIPTDLNASTAAVWSQNDNSPAVVTTDQSTFLGWRWGMNAVAPPAVDSAWLRSILSRYNLTPSESKPPAKQSAQYCAPSQSLTANQPVISLPNRSQPYTSTPTKTPLPSSRVAEVDPDVGVAPARILVNSKGPLTTAQVNVMSEELNNLIGRVESALLAANATNSNVNLPTDAANEKLKVERLNVENSNLQPTNLQPATPEQLVAKNSAIRAVVEARMGLQNFLNAVAKKDYNRARQQWLEARRTLLDNYPIDRKLAQPEIRAIWLDRKTIVSAKSEQDLAKIFDKLAAAGFNTVFFETVNASYPIYPSRVAPAQNPLVKGWDPLAAAVKLAHARGMELHAWVWIFAAANQRHNTILNQPANYPGPVLKAHPDWAILDKRGRLFDPNSKKAFLDPANPEVRRYLMALLEEIATRYEVDGIQLDYIRYPFQNPQVNQTYGYGKASRQLFKELTGYDPIRVFPNNRDLWQKWTDFRIQQIDNFVATAASRLRQQRPSLILSAAVFPLPRPERLQRLQQNWETWAIRGDIDLVVPMTYALDATGLDARSQPVLMQSPLSSALILPAIRLLNLPNNVAFDQIQLLRDSPVGGYALFAAENLDANLQSILQRTQGRNSSSEPIPYRQPLKAASARYTALQQEWNFLLANNQILLQEPTLSEWRKQTDTLSTLLEPLAKEPSMQDLLSAKAFLVSFRSQFQRWMQNQRATQPYQVQVWDNRLVTIERLLHYGEQMMLNQQRKKVSGQR
ncbi:MAG: family 10 glycosylhydrolase [Cyanobacteriota bacterium]